MLPFISQELPGIGGILRTEPEDFIVQEIPAYEPSGNGEHVMLEITKRGITTQNVVTDLSRLLAIAPETIGYAGMKDRQAVTTQRMTIPAEALPRLEPGLEQNTLKFTVRVLGLHDSKIRKGHLSGNKFTIRVRETAPDWAPLCADIAQILGERGFANFYGPQRFGRMGDNARAGENAVKSGKVFGPKWRKWLMISAFQSELFNRWLTARIADGLFSTALMGDVFGRLPKGGVFLSQDPSAEQPRMDAFEISPMGPIFGYKVMKTSGVAQEREQQILATAGIELPQFRQVKAEGSRRRCRLKVEDLQISTVENDPVFSFTLPSGSYATVFLNEFMKCAPNDNESTEVDAED